MKFNWKTETELMTVLFIIINIFKLWNLASSDVMILITCASIRQLTKLCRVQGETKITFSFIKYFRLNVMFSYLSFHFSIWYTTFNYEWFINVVIEWIWRYTYTVIKFWYHKWSFRHSFWLRFGHLKWTAPSRFFQIVPSKLIVLQTKSLSFVYWKKGRQKIMIRNQNIVSFISISR